MQTKQSPLPQFKLRWLYLCWFGTFFCTAIIMGIAFMHRGDPTKVVENWQIFGDFTLFAIVCYVTGVALAALILRWHLGRFDMTWADLGLKGKLTWGSAGMALLFLIVGNLIYMGAEAFVNLFGLGMHWDPEEPSHLSLTLPTDYFFAVVFAGIIGPIAEEVIFRGYLVTLLKKRLRNTGIAVAIAALIFTSIHIFYGPGALLFIFLWSFLPSYLFLKYKCLYPAVLLHILNNLLAFVVYPLVL
jgi:membrane protease YdiL (CAAX protease family)